MSIILNLVKLIHFLLILFVIAVPFWGTNYLLIIHFIIVPFIMLHWIVNDNTCCLTVLEKLLSKDKNYKGVLAQIIEPVYDFKKDYQHYSTLIYIIAILLWGITTYKLYNRYSQSDIKKYGFNMENVSRFIIS